jgi:hypothetical protein
MLLKKVAKNEHVSGVHSMIVAACAGPDISSQELAQALDINKKTAVCGKNKRHEYDLDLRSKLFKPPVLKREKLSPETEQTIKLFIADNITPSSSTKNVRQKKINGVVEKQVQHWRTDSLEDLHNAYTSAHPNNKVSFSAFYSRIPWYVYTKPQRTVPYKGIQYVESFGTAEKGMAQRMQVPVSILQEHRESWMQSRKGFKGLCRRKLSEMCKDLLSTGT